MEAIKKAHLPEIQTSLPGPKSKLWMQKYVECFGTRMRPRMAVNKAYGCILEDVDGNKFLDFAQSICVTGHSLPEIVNSSIDQTRKMITRGSGATPFLECANLLLSNLSGELRQGRVNYCVSGTETIELALSLARAYTKRPIILSYLGSHHGLIGTPNQLSSDPRIKETWTAKISDNIHIPYPTCYRCPFEKQYPDCDLLCLRYLENILETVVFPNQVAGLIIEPIIVNGGLYVPPEAYMRGILGICQKNNIQLILDEVFTGFGKTGKFLAVDHWKIIPDILCFGKPMGGGFPLSAVVTRREITDKTRGDGPLLLTRVTGTYAGNSVACVASISTMKYIEKYHLAENAKKMGDYLIKSFKDLSDRKSSIGDVRGRGLLIGVELVKDKKTKEPASEEASKIVQEAFDSGLIIGTAGQYRNVLSLHPPLILNFDQAQRAVEILDKLIN